MQNELIVLALVVALALLVAIAALLRPCLSISIPGVLNGNLVVGSYNRNRARAKVRTWFRALFQ